MGNEAISQVTVAEFIPPGTIITDFFSEDLADLIRRLLEEAFTQNIVIPPAPVSLFETSAVDVTLQQIRIVEAGEDGPDGRAEWDADFRAAILDRVGNILGSEVSIHSFSESVQDGDVFTINKTVGFSLPQRSDTDIPDLFPSFTGPAANVHLTASGFERDADLPPILDTVVLLRGFGEFFEKISIPFRLPDPDDTLPEIDDTLSIPQIVGPSGRTFELVDQVSNGLFEYEASWTVFVS